MESSPILQDTAFNTNVFLSREDAQMRAKCINDITYKIDLSLPKGTLYCGSAEVQFKLVSHPAKNIFLDFKGLKIG